MSHNWNFKILVTIALFLVPISNVAEIGRAGQSVTYAYIK